MSSLGTTIDVKSDENYYIIYKDGKKFVKVNKSNDLDKVIKFYNATIKEN